MFGAFYFGQPYFADAPLLVATPPSPCGAQTFGGFYFGDWPQCVIVPPIPPIPPIPPKPGGGGIVRPRVHALGYRDFPRVPEPVCEDLEREELEIVAMLTCWLSKQ
jgi:hypothetical protein